MMLPAFPIFILLVLSVQVGRGEKKIFKERENSFLVVRIYIYIYRYPYLPISYPVCIIVRILSGFLVRGGGFKIDRWIRILNILHKLTLTTPPPFFTKPSYTHNHQSIGYLPCIVQ